MPSSDPASDTTPIKDLKVGMRNFSVYVIFLEVNPRTTISKEGVEIRTCKVADKTACINFTIMGSDVGSYVQPGDICKITKCYVSNYKGSPTLYMAKSGSLLKYSEFSLVFNESLNISEPVPNSIQPSGSVPVVDIE
uniref:SOSS complex subunit B1 n=1 Tax=Aceria tosichella TaxID=561515 RepID=A0A6G1SJV9_9ACAR